MWGGLVTCGGLATRQFFGPRAWPIPNRPRTGNIANLPYNIRQNFAREAPDTACSCQAPEAPLVRGSENS